MIDVREGRHFEIGDHEVDIIVHGFPGKSVCHGTLGFSTIALVRRRERVALIDVGDRRYYPQGEVASHILGYVGAAATKSTILGLIILITAGFFVDLQIAHPFYMFLFLILTSVQ